MVVWFGWFTCLVDVLIFVFIVYVLVVYYMFGLGYCFGSYCFVW